MDIKLEKPRTLLQNKSLHLAFKQIADTLNESGIDFANFPLVIDVPWNALLVKEALWKPIQTALTGRTSTTALNTNEINEIFKVIAKGVSEITHQDIVFPSIESLMEKDLLKD
jgi:hypothetical protein